MDASAMLMTLSDKIPKHSLPIVKEKLENATENQLMGISMANFKSPTVGLVLGLLFGGLGVDRFYKGDTGLGIAKIALLIIGCIATFFLVGVFVLIGWYIWVFVDYFLVWKGIKKQNLELILMST